MKALWLFIDKKTWKRDTKYKAALLIFGVLAALAGFLVWLAVRNTALDTGEWLICLIGYPVLISWVVVFIFSCHHEFHQK